MSRGKHSEAEMIAALKRVAEELPIPSFCGRRDKTHFKSSGTISAGSASFVSHFSFDPTPECHVMIT
jgi:hypothetical protein